MTFCRPIQITNIQKMSFFCVDFSDFAHYFLNLRFGYLWKWPVTPDILSRVWLSIYLFVADELLFQVDQLKQEIGLSIDTEVQILSKEARQQLMELANSSIAHENSWDYYTNIVSISDQFTI